VALQRGVRAPGDGAPLDWRWAKRGERFSRKASRTYFVTLSKKGLTVSTLSRRQASISEFGRWGARQRLLTETRKARRPQRADRPPPSCAQRPPGEETDRGDR
jgi:hypothetical protein